MSKVGAGRALSGLRVGHLMRIAGYLEIAIISMWTGSPRAPVTIGMAEASVRGEGPGGEDGDLLTRLRVLVGEAKEYYAAGDFPAAMARMRVAEDLTALHAIRLAGE